MPDALGAYFCSSALPLRTSKASGADAQNRSTWLLDLVSSTYLTPALVLRFCTSSVTPGVAFSNAFLIGSVTSFEKEVTTVTLPVGPCAFALADTSAAKKAVARIRNMGRGIIFPPAIQNR